MDFSRKLAPMASPRAAFIRAVGAAKFAPQIRVRCRTGRRPPPRTPAGDAPGRDGGVAERISGAQVSPNLFPLLGVPPLLGRTFTEQEAGPGGERVAILRDAQRMNDVAQSATAGR